MQNIYVAITTNWWNELTTNQIRRRLLTIIITLLIISYSLQDYGEINRVLRSQVVLVDTIAIPNRRTVDIISVGSLLKEPFQDAQEQTFGSHPAVRNFFRVTEMTDTDQECFTDLTYDQLDEISKFCKNSNSKTPISHGFRRILFNPKKNAGWMCAQKRPIDGLHHVLKQYQAGTMEIPRYLFIIDDDTYINMESLTDMLNNFPYDTPHLVAGCNFVFMRKQDMTFPYGGFGSFITRASIQRLLQPIYCKYLTSDGRQRSDPFNRLTCWRLNENLMGEKQFFTEGMSVLDLMYKYSSEQPFSNASNWHKDAGYCFHSDHALAYFLNVYHIAVPDSALNNSFAVNDELRKKYKYTGLHDYGNGMMVGECYNEKEKCLANNTVCHYIQPNQMFDLFRANSDLAYQRQ
jgi:hypothetical protein